MKYRLYSDDLYATFKEDDSLKELVKSQGSWHKGLIYAISQHIIPIDHGTIQYFIEQYWMDHRPQVYIVKPTTKLNGIDGVMDWPDHLPPTFLIKPSPKIKFAGSTIPAISISSNLAAQYVGFKDMTDYVLSREGISGLIKAPDVTEPYITVNYIDPHERHVKGSRIMTYMTAAHLAVLNAAQCADEYFYGMNEKGDPLGLEEGERKETMFNVHQLVLATLKYLRTEKPNNYLPRPVRVSGKTVFIREVVL